MISGTYPASTSEPAWRVGRRSRTDLFSNLQLGGIGPKLGSVRDRRHEDSPCYCRRMRFTCGQTADALAVGLVMVLVGARVRGDSTSTRTSGAAAWIRGDMVEISGGSFAMGCDDVTASDSQKPVHAATVATFRLDRTEVTVAAYGECVRAGRCGEPEAYRDERGNYRSFCNWRHPQGRAKHIP